MKQPIPLLTAAQALLDAMGGNPPDWLAKEAADLEAALRSLFSAGWPHGTAVYTMPLLTRHETREGAIPPPERQPQRIESGPVQFGDDWPGLFIRGDACFAYALALKAQLADKSDAFSRAGIEGLIKALESTREAKGTT